MPPCHILRAVHHTACLQQLQRLPDALDHIADHTLVADIAPFDGADAFRQIAG